MQFTKQTLTQEHILFSELEKCAMLAILCKYLTNTEDERCSQWKQHRKRTNAQNISWGRSPGGPGWPGIPGKPARRQREGRTEPGSLQVCDENLWAVGTHGPGSRGEGEDLTFRTCLSFRPWTPWVPRLPFLSQGSGANNLNYRGKDRHTARQGLGVCVIAQTKKHTVFTISRRVRAEKQPWEKRRRWGA